MQDTLSKLPSETVEKVVGIITPVSLIIGVALYGVRVGSIVMEKQRYKNMEENTSEFIQEPLPNFEYENQRPQDGFRMSETIIPPMSNLGDL